MAISAILELRETPGSKASKAFGAVFKTYTVLDLDYTLKRNYDKTGRPSSGCSIEVLNITIRVAKEMTAKFHEWIKGDDVKMDGSIKIYDSTGYATSWSSDAFMGETGNDLDLAEDLIDREAQSNLDELMDDTLPYGEKEDPSGDIFDEMDRSALLNYIASKGLDVETSSTDSDDTIRKRIRYYNKISKMTPKELKEEATTQGVTVPENSTEKDYLRALAKHNNETTATTSTTTEGNPSLAEKQTYKTADDAKKAASKTASTVAQGVAKIALESARSITFHNAYCVSLREHYSADPDHKGTLDSSYPWVIELGIKPGTLVVNGWNMMGSTIGGKGDVTFEFFK